MCSVFETSIRYLAASISAYELSNKQYPALITKAKQVADKMSVAWVGVSVPRVLNVKKLTRSSAIHRATPCRSAR